MGADTVQKTITRTVFRRCGYVAVKSTRAVGVMRFCAHANARGERLLQYAKHGPGKMIDRVILFQDACNSRLREVKETLRLVSGNRRHELFATARMHSKR